MVSQIAVVGVVEGLWADDGVGAIGRIEKRKAIRLLDSRRSQEERVHHAEDRQVGAQSQGQNEKGAQRETWLPRPEPDGKANVLDDPVHLPSQSLAAIFRELSLPARSARTVPWRWSLQNAVPAEFTEGERRSRRFSIDRRRESGIPDPDGLSIQRPGRLNQRFIDTRISRPDPPGVAPSGDGPAR